MTYLSEVAGPRLVYCHNASVHNAIVAASVRVLTAEVGGHFVPIAQTRRPHGHSRILDLARDALLSRLVECTAIPAEQFAGTYCGLKKRVYERAYHSLQLEPLGPDDARIKAFIKFEKILGKMDGSSKAPRMISPPSARFLLKTGCYVKPAEHVVYAAIDNMFGFKVVTKGLNYREVGNLFSSHWSEILDPVSFDIDVKKMDRSTSSEMLGWTHQFITGCYANSDEISRLLKQQLRVKTRVQCDDGAVYYTVDGTLTSGQMNTSLVGVTMISSCMYVLFANLGIPYRFVDAGDDCTVIIERHDARMFLNRVRPFFSSVGFELTISSQNDRLEGIDFCQTHPVLVGGSYTMVRNVQDAVVKDATSLRKLRTRRELAVWMKAVSLCGLATHSRVPVAQSLYLCYGRNADRMLKECELSRRQETRTTRAVERLCREGLSWNMSQAVHQMVASVGEISPATRLSYFEAFDLTPPYQVALEGYYNDLVIEYGPHLPWERSLFNQLWS